MLHSLLLTFAFALDDKVAEAECNKDNRCRGFTMMNSRGNPQYLLKNKILSTHGVSNRGPGVFECHERKLGAHTHFVFLQP